MASPEDDPRYFGFQDIEGFKDFLVEVITGAPDDFMEMDWLSSDEQMNLDRAFKGLQLGLALIETKLADRREVRLYKELVEGAYNDYRARNDDAGRHKLEELERLVKRFRS